jgi:uncharacterized membrane protein
MGGKQLHKFCSEHGLTIAASVILALWIALYTVSKPDTHWGAFFGNAIADWSGVVLLVVGTKIFMERGSKETKRQSDRQHTGILRFINEHSFSIFVILTLGVWIIIFNSQDPTAKWGQVVGNIVSEWTQALGLIFLTKRLRERGSEESKD